MQFTFAIKLARILVVSTAMSALCTAAAHAQIGGGLEAVRSRMLLTFDFSCDGSMFVAGGDSIMLFDTESGRTLHEIPSPELVRTARFSPTERNLFATRSDEGVIRIWRVGEREPLRVLGDSESKVEDFAFSPDGSLIAGCYNGPPEGDMPGTLKFWNVETGELTQSQEFEDCAVIGVAFSRDGKLVAFLKIPIDGSATTGIEIYEHEMWQHFRSIDYSPGRATTISFAPDDRKLLISGVEGVKVSERDTRSMGRVWLAELDSDQPARLLTPLETLRIRSAEFAPMGDRFTVGTAVFREGLIGENENGRFRYNAVIALIQMRNSESGEVIWSQDGEIGHPYDVTISSDGSLVGCCSGESVLIFDAQTGERIRKLDLEE